MKTILRAFVKNAFLLLLITFGFLHKAVQAQDNAAFVSQSVPTTMVGGQTYQVTLTFRNTGKSGSWYTNERTTSNHKLGSWNPEGNMTWGLNRVLMATPAGTAIGYTGIYTFKFTVTAPSTPGIYNFQWRMLEEGVGWFGATSWNVAVNVSAPQPRPTINIQRNPSPLIANQNFTVTHTTSDATSLSYNCSANGTGFQGSANVPVNGTLSGVADPAWAHYPSTCVWTATGPGGTTTV